MFIEIVGRWLIPVLIGGVMLMAALLAIYRADVRERDKRRREEIISAAEDFISSAADYEWGFRAFAVAFADADNDEERKAKYMEFYPKVAPLVSVFRSIALRLRISGATSVHADVEAYRAKTRNLVNTSLAEIEATGRIQTDISTSLTALWTDRDQVIDAFQDAAFSDDRRHESGWMHRIFSRF